jgi:cell division protein FtsB
MNAWLTLYRLASAACAVIVIVAVVAFFLPKVRQMQDRARRAAVIEEENRAREEMIRQLRQQQERFVSDPKYVERVAREELGKAKPGETVFRFTEKKTNEYRIHR